MSYQRLMVWTCDGCGDTHTIDLAKNPPPDGQPRTWGCVYVISPPLADITAPEYQKVKADLCTACLGQLKENLGDRATYARPDR